MTKREFYKKFRGECEVSIGEIQCLIGDEDLYERIEIKDDYEFDDWIYDEIRNYYLPECGWRETRDFLNDIDDSYSYYLFSDYSFERGISEFDIPELLDEIESILEDECDEWEDDLPEEDSKTEVIGELELLFRS